METKSCPICQSHVGLEDTQCFTCGFMLRGATMSFEPLVLDDKLVEVTSASPHDASLRIVRGPQVGITYTLGNGELTIGRSPQCSIFLNDMTVSRDHARLNRVGGIYYIEDEDSFNGTWVNNVDVKRRALMSGDFIQIGAFCLLFEEK